ncbi:hypothetical protein [Rhizobium sp. WSM1325]|uniref:hypothetical protein n=1 Tax=Rhizobium sp. WSM1325 TaxID=3444086 RepID=UPI000FF3E80B|nr:hypothetical protein [Rhizobium leguminosarum]RWY80895.1 hypothetical protein EHI48_05660 [Rhizobium leguminosarum]
MAVQLTDHGRMLQIHRGAISVLFFNLPKSVEFLLDIPQFNRTRFRKLGGPPVVSSQDAGCICDTAGIDKSSERRYRHGVVEWRAFVRGNHKVGPLKWAFALHDHAVVRRLKAFDPSKEVLR